MGITAHQAKYLAYELTRRFASDDRERVASVLLGAQVDLNHFIVSQAIQRQSSAHVGSTLGKPTNKAANTLKIALSTAPKLLLTATPLQNLLMELYGLVSVIDDYAFGDAKPSALEEQLLFTAEWRIWSSHRHYIRGRVA